MKKLLMYGVAIVAVIAIWITWYSTTPTAKQIRATRTFAMVDAPADRVWQTLTNTAAYPEWNPYVTRADGAISAGGRLSIVERVGGRNHGHRVTVNRFLPAERQFAWKGGLGPLLSWEELFSVQAIDASHSQVTVTRAYQGLLLPLYWKLFNLYDLEAVRKMGSALKSRCEK